MRLAEPDPLRGKCNVWIERRRRPARALEINRDVTETSEREAPSDWPPIISMSGLIALVLNFTLLDLNDC